MGSCAQILSQARIIQVLFLFFIVFLSSCQSEPGMQAHIVKETVIDDVERSIEEESLGNQKEHQQDEIKAQIITERVRLASPYEEFIVGGRRIHFIPQQSSALLFSVDGQEILINEGRNDTIDEVEITLHDILRERKESYGLVSFHFLVNDVWKQLTLAEQDAKTYGMNDNKHTVTVSFIGERRGEETAVFIVNDQQSKILGEDDEFYFKDGSYIYVADIHQRTSAKIVETLHANFDITVHRLIIQT